MIVLRDIPPNFAEIASVFPEVRNMLKPTDREVVHFSWGRIIYNPSGHSISRHIHQHELVHSEQQLGAEAFRSPANPYRTSEESQAEDAGIRAWWSRYLVDVEFRLDQEWPAHLVELQAYRKRHGEPGKRAAYVDAVAAKLSGPLYGGIISFQNARDALILGRLEQKVGASGVNDASTGTKALHP